MVIFAALGAVLSDESKEGTETDELTQKVKSDDDKTTDVLDEPKAKVETPITEPNETVSQKNDVRSAQNYLNYTAFSKSGLIKQLEFEKFSKEDATYAVNKLNVNWKEQAVKSAQHYLNYGAFSKDGLIDQLIYEGFSNDEAIFGVDKVGL